MQIVIPMSGYGERFRKAGYKVEKAKKNKQTLGDIFKEMDELFINLNLK